MADIALFPRHGNPRIRVNKRPDTLSGGGVWNTVDLTIDGVRLSFFLTPGDNLEAHKSLRHALACVLTELDDLIEANEPVDERIAEPA